MNNLNHEADFRREICPGCRMNRYNYPGTCERPGIDAPVTSKRCWHMEAIKYDVHKGKWICPARY